MKKITRKIRKKRPSLPLLALLLLTTFSYSQAILEVRGNNTLIANGDTTPITGDFTDFGNVPSGNKFSRTFVLKTREVLH